jgi:hypothetical protein
MRLLLSAGTWTDEVLLVNNPAASRLYYSREDSRKMSNPNLNLAFVGKTPPPVTTIPLAISSYPLSTRDTLPLSIKIASGGYLTLTMTSCNITGKDMFLWDRHTGAFYPFSAGVTLVVSNDTTDTRYALLIKNQTTELELLKIQFLIYPNPSIENFYIKVPRYLIGQKIKLINQLGSTILEQDIVSETTEVKTTKIPSGIYFVEVSGYFRKKIFIQHF